MRHSTQPRSPLPWKLFVPLGFSVLGLCTLKLLDPHLISRDQILSWLRPLGPWMPIAFLVLLTIRPITLLPGQLLTAVGGILFGGWKGTLLALVGSALGSTLTFVVSRKLGGRFIQRRFGTERLETLSQIARSNDFWFSFLFTLNPLVPTDPILAIAASAGARYSRTLAGTLLAIVPGTIATSYFGMALSTGHPWLVVLSVIGMVVSVVGGALIAFRIYRDLERTNTASRGEMKRTNSSPLFSTLRASARAQAQTSAPKSSTPVSS
jgi:uncharacterized membrane protein YdjX (TVP38/TMEM64 family)